MSDFDPYGGPEREFERDGEDDVCIACNDVHGTTTYRCQLADLGVLRCTRRPRHRGQHCNGERLWKTPPGGVAEAARALIDKVAKEKAAAAAAKGPPATPPHDVTPQVVSEAVPSPAPGGAPAMTSPIDGLRPKEKAARACEAHEHPWNLYDHCGRPTGDSSICTRRTQHIQHDGGCCSGRVPEVDG